MEQSTSYNYSDSFITIPTIREDKLQDLKVGFFIDVSGSTKNKFANNLDILDVERKFVESFLPNLSQNPKYVSWHTYAQNIDELSSMVSDGDTVPSSIFTNQTTSFTISNLDIAVIITDGDIDIHEINRFSKHMTQEGAHLKGIVGVIVGSKTTRISSHAQKKPSEIDVSVLVPAMISNGCILFHDNVSTYIMWTCGIFKSVWNPVDVTNTTDWPEISTICVDKICSTLIPIHDEQQQIQLRDKGYIPFGSGLFFNKFNLLNTQLSWDSLLTLPFDRICQYFKVTQTYEQLITWFKIQKDRFVQELISESTEKEIINNFISEIINNQNQRNSINARSQHSPLLSSYIETRNRALILRYPDNEEIEHLFDNPKLVQLLYFFKTMMQIMEEDNQGQEIPTTYTPLTISSSRYSVSSYSQYNSPIHSYAPAQSPWIRPSTASRNSTNTFTACTNISANFDEPYLWFKQFDYLYPNHKSIKMECEICCEIDVPFIIIRKHFDINNITDLVEHSLSYHYPAIVCSKCAGLFCTRLFDPFRVPCFAAIPIINLPAGSKQIYLKCFSKLTNYDFNSIAPVGLPVKQPARSTNSTNSLRMSTMNADMPFTNSPYADKDVFMENSFGYKSMVLMLSTLIYQFDKYFISTDTPNTLFKSALDNLMNNLHNLVD